MKDITGKDMVDMMAEGIEQYVRKHILKEIVGDLVKEFEENITTIISDKIAEMSFRANSQSNHEQYRQDLHVLIQWAKTEPEYKTKYTMQSEIVAKEQ